MTVMARLSILSIAIGLFGVGGAGCGGGSESEGAFLNAPASSAAFSGTTIKFNPTITFTTASGFEYVNDADDVGPLGFGATAAAPQSGTFSYAAGAVPGNGTLTLNFTDPGVNGGQPLVLELSKFEGTQTGISAFQVNVVGVGTFNGQVVSGSLVPASGPSSDAASDGGGAGDGGVADSVPATVPDFWAGTYDLVFFRNDAPAPTGFPYQDDSALTVTVTAGANGTLSFGGKTLTGPYHRTYDGTVNEFEILWDDMAGGLTYALSFDTANRLNDLNVFTLGTTTFLGQFHSPSSGLGSAIALDEFPTGSHDLIVGNVMNQVGTPPDSVPNPTMNSVFTIVIAADGQSATLPDGTKLQFSFASETSHSFIKERMDLTTDVEITLNFFFGVQGETRTFSNATLTFGGPIVAGPGGTAQVDYMRTIGLYR